jgi:hypothetical protein
MTATEDAGQLPNARRGAEVRKLKPEFKKAWVGALRSGDYKQGKNYLKQEDRPPVGAPTVRHCCLGVAAEIACKAGVVTEDPTDHPGRVWDHALFIGKASLFQGTAYPPIDVGDWAEAEPRVSPGYPEDYDNNVWRPHVVYEDGLCDLAHLNDAGLTFDEIADLIEEQL